LPAHFSIICPRLNKQLEAKQDSWNVPEKEKLSLNLDRQNEMKSSLMTLSLTMQKQKLICIQQVSIFNLL
jgi:hypothetical protein